MTALPDHPDANVLTRFAAGLLDEDALDVVAAHLSGCAACRRLAESIPEDALSQRLRTAHQVGQHAGFPAPGPAALPDPQRPPAALVGHPRYEILGYLGSGGMGVVYKARHRLMGRTVALKVIARRLLADPGAAARFLREAEAAARLTHPNIVAAYDADRVGDTYFLVMEYVAGTSLARLVEGGGPLPPERACQYARQAALGLQHAHECGMVHRDVKPQNLMLGPGGEVKILDFGLARLVREAGSIPSAEGIVAAPAPGGGTAAGAVLGTADYLAPEQAQAPAAADRRADVYGLGRTLLFLLTGSPEGEPPPNLPPALADVVRRMTHADPDQRYQSAVEAAAALAPFVSGRGKERRLGPIVAVLAGLSGLGVALATVAGLRSPPEVSRPPTPVKPSPATDGIDRVAVQAEDSGRSACEGGFVTRLGPNFNPPWERRVLAAHEQPVVRVAFTADGHRALSLDQSGQFGEWELDGDGHRSWALPGPAGRTSGDIAFVGEGAPLALVRDLDRKFVLRDGKGMAMSARQVAEARRSFCGPVALSPDGRLALAGAEDGGLCWWEMPNGPVHVLRPDAYHAQAAVFLTERRAVYSANDGSVRLVDLTAGREIRRLPGRGSTVTTLVPAPDRRMLAAGLGTGEVLLWNPETEEVRVLVRPAAGAAPSAVLALAFTPDGRRCLLTRSSDFEVSLVSVSDGTKLCGWRSSDSVTCLALATDGRQALAGHYAGALSVWEMPP